MKADEKVQVKDENQLISRLGDKYLLEMSIEPGATTRTMFFVGLFLLCKAAQIEKIEKREVVKLFKIGMKKAKIE